MSNKLLLTLLISIVIFSACTNRTAESKPYTKAKSIPSDSLKKKEIEKVSRIEKSNAEWKNTLSSNAYHVLREKGTERAFTGEYWDNHEKGIYNCAACGLDLFSSETKFESGTGWPSFWKPIEENHVRIKTDNSFGISRDEVTCARCDGHLGHVFSDGPKPTGLRYCMNSIAMTFEKK
jgi:peptide-methionine (R)-S-oxide reductase